MLSLYRSTCVKEALFSPSREVILASKLLAASAAIAAISACQGVGGSAEARTQIRAVGSSTVYPFTTAVAEQFRSEEHTSELQSLMRISYAVFCLKKKQT